MTRRIPDMTDDELREFAEQERARISSLADLFGYQVCSVMRYRTALLELKRRGIHTPTWKNP